MSADLLTVLVSIVVGIASSYLTFRLQFARHQAMDVEREKHWTIWRTSISADVEELKKAAGLPQLAALVQKVSDMDKRLAAIERQIIRRSRH